jgi:integrase
MQKRVYGTGSLRLVGNVYHARFYDAAGIRHSESTKTNDEKKALRYLQRRLGQIAAGLNPQKPKSVGKLATNYVAHMEVEAAAVPAGLPAPTLAWRKDRKKKGLALLKARWTNHLEAHFAGARAVRADMLDEYVSTRRKEGAADATIARELALLRRILKFNNVRDVPQLPSLAEASPREGFVEDAQFSKLQQAIKDTGLRAMVTVLYRYGFRKSELQNLLVQQVEGRALKLLPGTTKNSRPRRVVLDAGTFVDVEPLLKGKGPNDYLFTWASGNTRGKQIRDFRAGWAKAAKAAGVPGLTPHDLRRSAIRNMVRRGVHERVARAISGHLTGEIFARYDIIGDKDLEEAAVKIGA